MPVNVESVEVSQCIIFWACIETGICSQLDYEALEKRSGVATDGAGFEGDGFAGNEYVVAIQRNRFRLDPRLRRVISADRAAR